MKLLAPLLFSTMYVGLTTWGLHTSLSRASHLDLERVESVESVDSIAVETPGSSSLLELDIACADSVWDQEISNRANEFLATQLSPENQPSLEWVYPAERNRLIAGVTAHGQNVSIELLRRGLALPNTHRQYCPDSVKDEVEQAVLEAQSKNLGIWSQSAAPASVQIE